MGFWELVVLAIGLSMDAFAVSICKGLALQHVSWKECCIAGLWFGGFQALMPLLGYLLGTQFEQFVTSVDHWIAFVLDTDGDGNSLSLIDILSEDDDMDEHLQADEVSRALRRCIDEVLDAREAEIIRLRYAIGGGEALTQRETAQRCGISRSYVSRIEKKAIEKLRAALQADGY